MFFSFYFESVNGFSIFWNWGVTNAIAKCKQSQRWLPTKTWCLLCEYNWMIILEKGFSLYSIKSLGFCDLAHKVDVRWCQPLTDISVADRWSCSVFLGLIENRSWLGLRRSKLKVNKAKLVGTRFLLDSLHIRAINVLPFHTSFRVITHKYKLLNHQFRNEKISELLTGVRFS